MQRLERKLTPKEQQRKAEFEKVAEHMRGDGYSQHDLTVGVAFANIAGPFLMLPFVTIVGLLYFFTKPSGDALFRIDLLFLPLFIVLIVLHEAIHGLTWGILSKDHFQSISFGIIWTALTPYCTCREPLKRWQYILGGLMPTWILGFAMAAVSIVLHSDLLFLLSEGMILAGCGDFLIALKLLLFQTKGKDVLFYDHPYECGLVAFERQR